MDIAGGGFHIMGGGKLVEVKTQTVSILSTAEIFEWFSWIKQTGQKLPESDFKGAFVVVARVERNQENIVVAVNPQGEMFTINNQYALS